MKKRSTCGSSETSDSQPERKPDAPREGNVLPFPERNCGQCTLLKGASEDDHWHVDRLKISAPYGGFSFLPKALQRWRTRHGLKINAAAQGLGVAASTWGHWETGYRFPTGSVLRDLVEYTGLSLVELICEHGETCPLIHKLQAPRPEPRQGA